MTSFVFTRNVCRKAEGRGFIALTSAIIISIVLLLFIANTSLSGFYGRVNVLESELKEQSAALAEGCVEEAALRLAIDPSYSGGEDVSIDTHQCTILPITASSNQRVITTSADIQDARTNLRVTVTLDTVGHVGAGGLPFAGPGMCADTLMMLDRTGSMSGTDLADECNAAQTLLDLYKNAAPLPKVGVGSFGGLSGSSAEVPLAGQLTNIYGDREVLADTGFVSPTATGGHASGWSNPNSAFSSNNIYATETIEDRNQSYENFGFNIPSGSTIKGIEVLVEAKHTDPVGCQIEPILHSVSANADSDRKVQAVTGSDATYILGSPTDLWGSTWAASDFSNANFYTEVQFDDTTGNSCSNGTLSLDHIQVKVYYASSTGLYATISTMTGSNSSVGTNLADSITAGHAELASARVTPGVPKVLVIISDGDPNKPGSADNAIEAALDAADAAKQDGIYIFTIHFGNDPAGFAGKELMAALASGNVTTPSHNGHSGPIHEHGSAHDQGSAAAENADGDYFFIAPSSNDLENLFNIIGLMICPGAGGSGGGAGHTSITVDQWEEVPSF